MEIAMIIELITPLVLATTPATIQVEPPNYDHKTQLSQPAEVIKVAGYTNANTWNGTQTGNTGGGIDHDNDMTTDSY